MFTIGPAVRPVETALFERSATHVTHSLSRFVLWTRTLTLTQRLSEDEISEEPKTVEFVRATS